MTAPGMGSWSELPRDVHNAAQLGSILQGLNVTKLKASSSGRLPWPMTDTDAGLVGGPMRIITDLFGQFLGGIADDAPGSPTLSTADDLPDLVTGFFGGLAVDPLRKMLGPLFDLLGWLTDTDPGGWDPEDLEDGLMAAVKRASLQKLADRIGGILGATVEDGLAQWLSDNNSAANEAADVMEQIRKGVVNGWAQGPTGGASAPVYETMGFISARIRVKGFIKVIATSTTLITIPAGVEEIILVGVAAGQNGTAGANSLAGNVTNPGGNGGNGGGHIAQAIPVTGVTAIHVTIGTNGASTVFRKNSAGGDILMTAVSGGVGAVATLFGYTRSHSAAGGGGGGGSGMVGRDANGSVGGLGGDSMVYGNIDAAYAGGRGAKSARGTAGARGPLGDHGGAGGSVPTNEIVCGGGGGGGGGSGQVQSGTGGAGGYPGGGGGGGGSAYYAGASAGGAGAAGLGYVFYR